MKKIFIIAASSLVLFTSCREIFAKRVKGSGNVTTQTRTAGQFNSIDVSGDIDVYVKQDSTSSIKIEADDNLQEYIEVVDDGDVLRIHEKKGFNLKSSKQIKVYVSSPSYKKFEASGASDIYSEGKISSTGELNFDLSGSCKVTMEVNVPKITSELSGACSMNLKGETKDFIVDGSGSTDIKSFDLKAENVSVDISGAGDAEVYASVKLDVHVSGAGDVKYKGNASVSQNTSGAGSVKKVE